MWPSVAARIVPWLSNFEGVGAPVMGLDIYGRVQTRHGCDLDDPRIAYRLTWRHAGGQVATQDEVYHEWARVKAMQSHKLEGGSSKAFTDSAHLYVDETSLVAYLDGLIAGKEAYLRTVIDDYDGLPAPAQLARLRTSYAGEGAHGWPKLNAALSARNWSVAMAECMPGDYGRQNSSYRASYDAVRELYRIADAGQGDWLPDPLPGEPGYVWPTSESSGA
jgi:hypothetical protein